MQDFIYHNPVKILFGRDQISALGKVRISGEILLG